MILLLNGPFGVGKTTVARRVVRERARTRLFDPEKLGFVLRRIPGLVPRGGDYQHLALWRTLTVWGIRLKGTVLGCDLVVPMTLAHEEYFDELRQRLTRFEPDLRHACLGATPETLHARLRERGDPDGAWSHAQVDRCVRALRDPRYAPRIDTDDLDAEAVAARVLALMR